MKCTNTECSTDTTSELTRRELYKLAGFPDWYDKWAAFEEEEQEDEDDTD